jgi:RNA polymerase sigma-70 factor, ECF subfamily
MSANCVGFSTLVRRIDITPPHGMPDRISEQELEGIYDDTILELYGYVSRRCGGRRDLAEDITQETWLRALRYWREHGVPKNALGWLTTVARNLVTSYFRRHQPAPLDHVSPAEILAAVEANAVSDSADVASLVSQALGRIPPAEARLLETFHYDRMKMSQLAEIYGISERAIEGRLRRARERLRRELEVALKGNGGVV